MGISDRPGANANAATQLHDCRGYLDRRRAIERRRRRCLEAILLRRLLALVSVARKDWQRDRIRSRGRKARRARPENRQQVLERTCALRRLSRAGRNQRMQPMKMGALAQMV